MYTPTLYKHLRNLALLACLPTFVSCVPSGSLSSDGSSSSSGSLKISYVYPTSSGTTWTAIKESNRFYIKGTSISIKGTCSGGIGTIQVNDGTSNYSETATCTTDGEYTWTKTYSAGTEINRTLTLTGLDASSAAVSDSSVSVDVRIDDMAPAPVITSPSATPYTYNGANSTYTIVGTVATDVIRIAGPAGDLTFTAPNFSYAATLVDQSTLNFTFTAYDLAGNVSASTTQQILWNPSVQIMAHTFEAGGTGASGVVGLEGTVTTFGTAPAGVGGVTLEATFNFITNSVRGL
jgi:hypothetical protein